MQYLFLKLALLTMLIQSFVVSNVIKGLLLSYVFILAQSIKDGVIIFLRRLSVNIFHPLLVFTLGFIAWQLLSQLLNVIYSPSFSELPLRMMVSPEATSVGVFRTSLFTQSMYLLMCVIFFLYVYMYLRATNDLASIIRLAKIGILFYVAYGFIEFFGFLLTGQNIDFISNRITGVGSTFTVFQTMPIGHLTIERMRSLAGEPCMFAFSIVPFAVLFYYIKDRIYILLFIVALLSTATTALLGLLLFVIIETVIFRRFFKLAIATGIIIAIISYIDIDIINTLYDNTLTKLTLQDVSGIDRFDNFYCAVTLFRESNIFHQLFGYGFGYVRSTDGFSTLLINTGIMGFIVYCFFFLYPLGRLKYDSDYRKGLLAANTVLFVLVMISVPEFYFFHVWFLAALSWYEYYMSRKARRSAS